jgi:predicted RNA-binding protein associated with RNAse of E/G family
MALPKAYLTSTKNVDGMLTAIQQGQAPKQFTTRFLEALGYKSSSDRLMIGVLKALKFLDESGTPTQRYFDYLDQGQSARVLAEGIREAYADLYTLNNKAHELTRADVKGKMKTLTQGQYTDAVLEKMVMTFFALAKSADFEASTPAQPPIPEELGEEEVEETPEADPSGDGTGGRRRRPALELGGLVYNIQIQLPESRDPAVYDALFASLRAHLLT